MKKKIISFLFLSFICVNLAENLMNNPESVVWDPVNNTWLVSNHGDGKIIAFTEQETQSIFSALLSSTRGLRIKNEKLYAASNDGLAIFDLATQELDNIIAIPDAVLLNDLEFDNDENLFVSDYWDNKIYKVDLEENNAEIFIDLGVLAPNGLIFDAPNNRILCAGNNGVTTKVFAFDVDTAEVEDVWNPTIHSLDGWSVDAQNNLYVSSWYTDAIYRFDGFSFENPITAIVSNVEDPADIFIRNETNELAIPLFYADSVHIETLETISNNAISSNSLNQFLVYPNPFSFSNSRSDMITFSVENKSKEQDFNQVEIYNILGQRIKTLLAKNTTKEKIEFYWNGQSKDGKNMGNGVYFAKFKANKKDFSATKFLLVK